MTIVWFQHLPRLLWTWGSPENNHLPRLLWMWGSPKNNHLPRLLWTWGSPENNHLPRLLWTWGSPENNHLPGLLWTWGIMPAIKLITSQIQKCNKTSQGVHRFRLLSQFNTMCYKSQTKKDEET